MRFITRAATAASASLLALGFATAAHAQYQVSVTDCASPKGTAYLDMSTASAWDTVKAKNPTNFITSMVAESSCFTMASAPSAATYTVRVGPLTPQEYAQGKSSFSGRSALEPQQMASGGIPQGGIPQGGGGIPQSGGSSGSGGFGLNDLAQGLATANNVMGTANNVRANAAVLGQRGSNIGNFGLGTNYNEVNNMQGALGNVDNIGNALGGLGGLMGGGNSTPKVNYAYVEIVNSAGQVVARGFGENNNADLAFDSWAGASTMKKFSKSKKSRRAGGAMFNAFIDAQTQLDSGSFGTPVY